MASIRVLELRNYLLTKFKKSVKSRWQIRAGLLNERFISKGKTIYNAINSFIVNIGYYGIMYALFKQGIFKTDMNFIIMMFGFGVVVHMIASVVMYLFEKEKQKNIVAA